MMIYEWFLYVVIVGSVGFCQGENSKHVCEFQNLNAVYESSSPIKLTRIIRCCDKIQCGGWEIQVAESGYNVTKIGPDWFINRTLANETAYLIKKKHRRIFQTPEMAGDVYQLPRNFTEGVEIALWVTPFNDFQQFTIRLQSDRFNHVVIMQPDSVLEDVILACLLHGDYACVNSSWATSIAPELDPFPFSSNVAIKIAFSNVAGAIEVKMNDVSYVNFTSGLPVEWAKEVKLEDDVYINRMEFWDTITDEVEKFIVL